MKKVSLISIYFKKSYNLNKIKNNIVIKAIDINFPSYFNYIFLNYYNNCFIN